MPGITLGALSAKKKISALGGSALLQRGDGDTLGKRNNVLVGDKCCEQKEEKVDEEPRMTGKLQLM